MRASLAVALLLLTLLSATAHGAGTGGKRRAELAWAKQTANDFLGAYLRGQSPQAEQLLTPELRKLPKDVLEGQLFEAHNAGFRRSEVKSETLAPGRDEAVFRVELLAEKADRGADMTLRITKTADGKWRVSFFRFVERPIPSPKQ